MVNLAVQVLQTVARDLFWEHLTDSVTNKKKKKKSRGWGSAAAAPAAAATRSHRPASAIRAAQQETLSLCLRVVTTFTTSTRSPSLSYAHKLLQAWWEAHQRCPPVTGPHLREIGLAAGGAAGVRLWTAWHESLRGPYKRMYDISITKHRYKTLVARANAPARRDPVVLWGNLRKLTAQRLIANARQFSAGLETVAAIFAEDSAFPVSYTHLTLPTNREV